MAVRFWKRVDRGGHRSRAKWTLHTSRPKSNESLCGLAWHGNYFLSEDHTPQGERKVCAHCARKEAL